MAAKPNFQKKLPAKEYIVGIGASAGGLEAIHEFFDNMPPDTNMAFVIVQHLSPDYKSLLAELVAKHTDMTVHEAEDGMALQRNSVYVIPTKKIMTVRGGRLRLHDKIKSPAPNTAIDTFFESLAKDKKSCSVGVILSGTGTDGSRGIEAIKRHRGVVVVQDPGTAKFDGMPNSAIATGLADLILPPQLMAEELIEYIKDGPLAKAFHDVSQKDEAVIRDILGLVKEHTSQDFTHYKRPTINRRLAKRMAERNFKSLQEYYDDLVENPEEVKKLCKDFLIGVTRFFRDGEAFERVRQIVLPNIFAGKKPDEPVKIWVVACSTGEEAYTLAILVQEYIEKSNLPDANVKIFATDIDQAALEVASRGIYPPAVEKDVPKAWLDKHFVREGQSYRVSPHLRRMVVFAQHDVLKDPPFSKLDFISCRNMLIYMNPVLQNNVHKTFHFALNTGGFLMLGPSENPGTLKDAVQELDKKWRIYKCVEKAKTLEHEPFTSPIDRRLFNQPSSKTKNAVAHLSDIFRDTLLEEYRMAGIFIDRDFEVKHAIGRFRDFMDFPESHFNFNLLKLVPPDLSVPLSMCVRKAIKSNEKAVIKGVKLHTGPVERSVTIVVKPYLEQNLYLQPFLFVVLSEDERAAKSSEAKG
ncbi:MAG TPA: chemotaxis protein CheB, partial [Chitinophagales bacterium]|nr:chemotaxis protein CheB [Chitinophagales bacterium]